MKGFETSGRHVLQFDHVRGEKIKDVSILMRDKASIDVLEAEEGQYRCAGGGSCEV